MKKSFVILGILLATSMSACSPSISNFTNDPTQDSELIFETENKFITNDVNLENNTINSSTKIAIITDINIEHSTIMIGESLDTDYELQIYVHLNENTKIYINGTLSNLDALSVGTQVEITYTGGILESAPSEIISPLEIKVTK